MKAKVLFLALLVPFLLAGCSTPRKLSKKEDVAVKADSMAAKAAASEALHFTDSTKSEATEVVYTKIEYYPPTDGGTQEGTRNGGKLSEGAPDHPEGLRTEPPNRGPVKSIENYTYKKDKEEKGIAKDSTKAATNEQAAVKKDSKVKENVKEKPAADPYRWRYIFGILLLLLVFYFVLRKSKLFKALKGRL